MGRAGVGGRGAGLPSLLRREKKLPTARTRPGPLAGFKGLRPTAGQGPKQRAGCSRGSVHVVAVVVVVVVGVVVVVVVVVVVMVVVWWLLLVLWLLLLRLWWQCGRGCGWRPLCNSLGTRGCHRRLVPFPATPRLQRLDTILATRVFCDTSGIQCSAVVSKPR